MFELVNPIIAGNITTKFEVDNPMDAAKKFWDTMTTENNLIVNEVFKFIFTLKDSKGKFHHFSVVEKEKKENVEYELKDITEEVEKKANENEMDQFKKEVSRVQKQIEGTNKKGGKKSGKKSSSSSSSSSSDDDDDDDEFDFAKIRRKMYRAPISYWWYSPMIYKVRRIYTPVFARQITPYVQLWMPM